MSDTQNAAETASVEPPEGADQQGEQHAKTFDADYVEKLRKENAKYRTEAKVNADAAARLAEIEAANKTAEERAAERLAAAEKAAADAEARALRREVAIEHRLDPRDAALLDNLTDEDTMRALAARLAPSEETGPRQPKPDANQGRSGAAGPKSTADSFADFFRKSLPER